MNLPHMSASTLSSKRFILAFLLMASVLLALQGSMTSYVYAQSTNSKIYEFKTKAAQEIDRRITNYKKTLQSMQVDIQLSSDSVSASVSSDGAGSNDPEVGKNFAVPSELKDKVRNYLEKTVEQLDKTKEKVQKSESLADMQKLAENIDAQYGINQLANVQGIVTQSTETMTGVLDKLKTSHKGLRDRAELLKDCADGVVDGSTSANLDITKDNTSFKCADLKTNVVDAAEAAETDLAEWSAIIQQISTILMTVVALLMSLVTQFTTLLSGLGNQGSMGNLSNLGNIGNLGGLLGEVGGQGGSNGSAGTAGSLGNITGLLTSFTTIISQLGIAQFMAGDAQGGLNTILTNMPSLLQTGAGITDQLGLTDNLGGTGTNLSDILGNLGGSGGFGSGTGNGGSGGTSTGSGGSQGGSS